MLKEKEIKNAHIDSVGKTPRKCWTEGDFGIFVEIPSHYNEYNKACMHAAKHSFHVTNLSPLVAMMIFGGVESLENYCAYFCYQKMKHIQRVGGKRKPPKSSWMAKEKNKIESIECYIWRRTVFNIATDAIRKKIYWMWLCVISYIKTSLCGKVVVCQGMVLF